MPIAGAFAVRRAWRLFRARFEALRRVPLLDYAAYRRADPLPQDFRFLGNFESVTDDHLLWVRNQGLTVPVRLDGARIYLLPSSESGGEEIPDSEREAPERIRWDRLSTLTDGVRVYIGGKLCEEGGKRTFRSTRATPLLVILYGGSDQSLLFRTIRAGRHRNEYWNPATPFALAIGIAVQLVIAVGYLPRPAFRLAALAAFAAMFGPLLPYAPPGVLFTAVYRRLWRRARTLRAYRDLVRLPLCHLESGGESGRLPDGSAYAWRVYDELAVEDPPLAIPPGLGPVPGVSLRVYGTVGYCGEGTLPRRPADPMGAYVLIPGDPVALSLSYSRRAYLNEAAAMALLVCSLAVNALFVALVLFLVR